MASMDVPADRPVAVPAVKAVVQQTYNKLKQYKNKIADKLKFDSTLKD